ncbi:hypothetical protein KUCAC02_000543 [Chaenocephalus aceratus]|uniref:Uncharacterized protein n=1 Tax=Chaenocephalus aceratus TaxID=36190 RepID=A0ACB9W740_CHAAC|nr:hypothetical protein KUCAC02_000543 [Chaenocephalus aceratus]
MGFVTGPKPLVDRVVLHIQASTMHTSTSHSDTADLYTLPGDVLRPSESCVERLDRQQLQSLNRRRREIN